MKKVTKTKCRRRETLDREYRNLHDTGQKGKVKRPDKSDGIGISVNFEVNPAILDPKTKKPYRLPSLIDYLLAKT
jgi:hypothetical protein